MSLPVDETFADRYTSQRILSDVSTPTENKRVRQDQIKWGLLSICSSVLSVWCWKREVSGITYHIGMPMIKWSHSLKRKCAILVGYSTIYRSRCREWVVDQITFVGYFSGIRKRFDRNIGKVINDKKIFEPIVINKSVISSLA